MKDSVKLNLGPMMFENLMPIQLSKDSLPFKVSGFLPAPDAGILNILLSYVLKKPKKYYVPIVTANTFM